MRSEEARVGVTVKVLDAPGRPALCGLVGTVEQIYGNPTYRALDVRLENGEHELFWHYELEYERIGA